MNVVEANETVDLIHRVRNVLSRIELDCRCRASLFEALDRFACLEHRRLLRRRLAQARDHKDRITALLALLSELDQIREDECDRTVFEEMALLFLEVADCANAGASALRAFQQQSLNAPEYDG